MYINLGGESSQLPGRRGGGSVKHIHPQALLSNKEEKSQPLGSVHSTKIWTNGIISQAELSL